MDHREQIAGKNKVEITDLYLFHYINDIYVTKNKVVYKLSKCLKDENKVESALIVLDKHRQKTNPVFSGEVKKILYADEEVVIFSEKDQEKNNRVLKVNFETKKSEVLYSTKEKISILDYTQDGVLVFSKSVNLSEDKNTEEYKVFEELPFWSNSRKIIDRTRLKLFIKKEEELELSTKKHAELVEHTLSPSGKKIAFIENSFEDINYTNNGILIFDMDLNKTYYIKKPNILLSYSNLCFFDENTLFFTANDLSFPGKNPDAFLIDLKEKKEYKLPYQDALFSGNPVSDMSYGIGGGRLLSDGNYMYFTRSLANQVQMFGMNKKGNIRQLTHGNNTVLDFGLYENELYILSMRHTELVEIYKIDLRENLKGFDFHKSNSGSQKQEKITRVNQAYLETHHIIKPEKFTFLNRDGIEMDVFVMLPNRMEDEKIPVVLQVHGGPKAVYTDAFYHEFQVLASYGFASVYSNPRGSDGRGSDFANIQGELGYKDYDDIMEAFDKALENYPILDENMAFISGGSYGGFITNWAITHTSRFKAACSQRSISNYLSKTFTSDIGYKHNIKQIGADPWNGIEHFAIHSPISYVNRCVTPTLFIHSHEDYRCWQSEGIQMYNGLKEHGCDARFCMFYGENHGLSRGGKPHNRITRLIEILNWFKRYSEE